MLSEISLCVCIQVPRELLPFLYWENKNVYVENETFARQKSDVNIGIWTMVNLSSASICGAQRVNFWLPTLPAP